MSRYLYRAGTLLRSHPPAIVKAHGECLLKQGTPHLSATSWFKWRCRSYQLHQEMLQFRTDNEGLLEETKRLKMAEESALSEVEQYLGG